MDTYRSENTTIHHNINTVYNALTHPERFKTLIEENIDRLPEQAREHIGKLQFEPEGIAIESPMGPVRLAIDHDQCQNPNRIVYTAAQAPVNFNLTIDLTQKDEENTDSVAAINVDLPFFIRGMVGNQLKAGAARFGEVLAMLPYESMA